MVWYGMVSYGMYKPSCNWGTPLCRIWVGPRFGGRVGVQEDNGHLDVSLFEIKHLLCPK